MIETITMEEAAAALDGSEYREECCEELFARMKASGIIACLMARWGGDHCMKLRGAVTDDFGCGPVWASFNAHGRVRDYGEPDAPLLQPLMNPIFSVESVWGPAGEDDGPEWLCCLSDSRPSATFSVMEDGDVNCIGIVFPLRWPT
jgi:hypothetical protein